VASRSGPGSFSAGPTALLGVLLVVAAASPARVALTATDRRRFVVAVGVLAAVANVGVAVLVGAAWWLLRTRGFRRPGANTGA
jgi:hypothetical protein